MEYKPTNIDAFAKAIYKSQCDYVGEDHEGKCVEILKGALQSMEDETARLTTENETLSARVKELEDDDGDLTISYMMGRSDKDAEIERLTARLKRLGDAGGFKTEKTYNMEDHWAAQVQARIDYANDTWEKDDG